MEKYLKLSNTKIYKKYPVPNMKQRTDLLDPNNTIYNAYRELCAEVHSSDSEILRRNTIK